MENNQAVREMLDTLSAELYNEIFTQLDGFWDEKTANLGNAIIEAVKSTRRNLYGSDTDT